MFTSAGGGPQATAQEQTSQVTTIQAGTRIVSPQISSGCQSKAHNYQNGELWVNHFSKCFGPVVTLESAIKDDQNTLDSPITLKELQDKISSLKLKKIHRSGDKCNPNNDREVCVNSNLGQVLCMIINSRLLNFLTDNNAISKNQIAFLPNDRTTDHMFTSSTLIDHQINLNKSKLFYCFVDFKKSLTPFGIMVCGLN